MNNDNVGRPLIISGMPKRGDLDSALGILNAVGGGDPKFHRMLEGLKEAIDHNQRLVAEAGEKLKALEDLERRERELAEREADINEKVARLDRIKASFEQFQEESRP